MTTKSIIVNSPINEVYNRIQTIKGYTLKVKDYHSYTLELSTGITLTSWGMKYPIRLIELSPMQTQIDIGMKPASPLQFDQHSEHDKCVKKIISILQ